MLKLGQGSEPRRNLSGEVVESRVDRLEAAQVREARRYGAGEVVGAEV